MILHDIEVVSPHGNHSNASEQPKQVCAFGIQPCGSDPDNQKRIVPTVREIAINRTVYFLLSGRHKMILSPGSICLCCSLVCCDRNSITIVILLLLMVVACRTTSMLRIKGCDGSLVVVATKRSVHEMCNVE